MRIILRCKRRSKGKAARAKRGFRRVCQGAVPLLAALGFIACCGAGRAAEGFRILAYGVFADGGTRGAEGDALLERIPLPVLREETRRIPPAPCRLFGFVFDGPAVPVHVHIRHPARPAPDGTVTSEETFDLPALTGPRFVGFRFETEEDEAPGVWEFSLSGGGERLHQIFEILSPPPSAPQAAGGAGGRSGTPCDAIPLS